MEPLAVKLSVGQQVYYVPNDKRWSAPCFRTITKIGRVWAELDNGRGRFNLQTFIIDGQGYSSPGRVYLSKEEYEERALADRLFSGLRQKMGYSAGDLKPHEIREAAKILRISLEVA